MKLEWIAAGVALLIAILTLKKINEQGGFRGLVLGFTVLWAAILAVQLWAPMITVLSGVGASLTAQQLALVSFWIAFAAGCVPSAILMGSWIKTFSTTYPPAADSLIQLVSAVVAGVTLATLVFMSGALYVDSVEKFDTRPYKFKAELAPLQAYLWLAGKADGEDNERTKTRLPATVQRFLNRYEIHEEDQRNSDRGNPDENA